MTTFYLIRHGETDWNVSRTVMGRTDVPLNPAGAKQVAELGAAMAKFPLDVVYSSPQLRARQTAEAVAAPHALPVATEQALAEVDFGKWIGQNWLQLQADPEHRLWLEDPDPPGEHAFETSLSVYRRTSAFLERVAGEKPDAVVALVSHADPVRAMVNFVLNAPLKEFRRIRIANGSLTVAIRDRGKWKLTLLNYRPVPDLRADV